MASDSTPPPSVLLVDDQPANLTALTAVLDSLGARLVEARSGAEALRLVEEETFAAVLLDVQMPVMDGFETAMRMRELPRGRQVPILFLTAIHHESEYAKRGYAVGAADYISKPFDIDIVRARVRSYIDLFAQREEAHRTRLEARTRQLDGAQRRLEAFEQIASAALESDEPAPFLHALATIFVGAADSADIVTLLLREGDELCPRASIGVTGDVANRLSVPVGRDFVGRIAATGKPELLVGEEISRSVSSPWLLAKQPRALYGAPLVHDAGVIGVAYIGSTKADAFSPAEMHLFQAIVQRASWAVSRSLARERVYTVLHAAPVAISVFRPPEFTCEFANETFRALFAGRGPGPGRGRDVVGLRAADLGATPEVIAMLERVARDGEAISQDEISLRFDWDGNGAPSERSFRFRLHPLRDAAGRLDGVLVVAVDLTAEVQARRGIEEARREAEQANRMKDEFLATIAHELRSPVSGILGWISSARSAKPLEARRAIDAIERSAEAQRRLLDDMLDIAQITSGRLRLDLASTDVSQLLFDAIEGMRPAAQAKDIGLEVRLGPDLGRLALDGGRMQQVVGNLLSNAVKFTPRGGSVQLRASRSPSALIIAVADTGEGIEPAFLPHVFEPFRQADASVARVHRGLGLGLAIARQLVLAHHGTIRIESAGLGKGATCTIELPVRDVPVLRVPDSRPLSRPRSRTADGVRLDGLRILLVEDETEALELVAQVLEHHGARVHRSATADEALRNMRDFRPNLVVSDLAMPQTDGYTLLRNIRSLPRELGGSVPAVALSARVQIEDRQRAFSAGFEEHIAKPVDPIELVKRIAEIASRRRD